MKDPSNHKTVNKLSISSTIKLLTTIDSKVDHALYGELCFVRKL